MGASPTKAADSDTLAPLTTVWSLPASRLVGTVRDVTAMLDATEEDELLRVVELLLVELNAVDEEKLAGEVVLEELELTMLETADDELLVDVVTGGVVAAPLSLPPPQALKLKARAVESPS